MLRAEVTARFGVVFDPIVNGQAEIAGVPTELLEQFSKRAREIDVEMGDKLADFLDREGRDPTGFEYAAMEREAASLGIDAATLTASIANAALQHPLEASPLDVSEVVGVLASRQSTWNRMGVLRTICDTCPRNPDTTATAGRPHSTRR